MVMSLVMLLVAVLIGMLIARNLPAGFSMPAQIIVGVFGLLALIYIFMPHGYFGHATVP